MLMQYYRDYFDESKLGILLKLVAADIKKVLRSHFTVMRSTFLIQLIGKVGRKV